MNRAALEGLRTQMREDAAYYVTLTNDAGPAVGWTPVEAYAAARWHAAMKLQRLLDALLAPEPMVTEAGVEIRAPAPPCGRGEIVGTVVDLAAVAFSRAQADMWRRMARDQQMAGLANWSA